MVDLILLLLADSFFLHGEDNKYINFCFRYDMLVMYVGY